MSINPLDDADGSFSTLSTTGIDAACGRASAMFRPVRRAVYGEAEFAARLDYLERKWSDIRPKSLRDRPAQNRDFDQ